MSKIKHCPFCGSDNIDVSDKTTTINLKRKRHVALYCKDCHSYGPRLICKEDGAYSNKATSGSKWKAVSAWNNREYSSKPKVEWKRYLEIKLPGVNYDK